MSYALVVNNIEVTDMLRTSNRRRALSVVILDSQRFFFQKIDL